MGNLDYGFVTLTHPVSLGAIAARADKVMMVEDCGDGKSLVNLENGESFMCVESVSKVVSMVASTLSQG